MRGPQVAVYMVRQYLGDGAPQPQISKLTGILAAIFMSAQFLTSYPWGLFSDIYGRKPLVVLGNACTTLAILLFGLAPSYLLACAARFLGGFFNCSYMCADPRGPCGPLERPRCVAVLVPRRHPVSVVRADRRPCYGGRG